MLFSRKRIEKLEKIICRNCKKELNIKAAALEKEINAYKNKGIVVCSNCGKQYLFEIKPTKQIEIELTERK